MVSLSTENKDLKGNLYNLYIKEELKNEFEITYAKKEILNNPWAYQS